MANSNPGEKIKTSSTLGELDLAGLQLKSTLNAIVIIPQLFVCVDGRQSWIMFQSNGINHDTKGAPASSELREERFTAINSSTTSSTKEEDNEEYNNSDASDVDILRKKKTPMCLINELARHHKVIIMHLKSVG